MMLPIFASRRVRNEIREWLLLAEDVRDFVRSIVAALHGDNPDRAREILETRIREQAAGQAAHRASVLAGARK